MGFEIRICLTSHSATMAPSSPRSRGVQYCSDREVCIGDDAAVDAFDDPLPIFLIFFGGGGVQIEFSGVHIGVQWANKMHTYVEHAW
jgi:hypothetical protein